MKSNETNRSNGTAKNSTNGKAAKQSSSPQKTNGKSNSERNSSKEEQGLRSLFEDSLKDIYWAEKALVKALPKMIKNATSPELVTAIEEHLAVTEEQVARLEEVFEMLGKPARAKKCEAMEGLLKEAEGIMEETEEGVVRDAGIISGAQKVEHYEIATYGTLVAFANVLGEKEVASLLEQTLNEEKEADTTLTQVAETSVNLEAAAEGEEEEMEEAEMGGKNRKTR